MLYIFVILQMKFYFSMSDPQIKFNFGVKITNGREKRMFLARNLLRFCIIMIAFCLGSCKKTSEDVLDSTSVMSFPSPITSLGAGNGDTLIVGTKDGTVYFYDALNDSICRTFTPGGNNPVRLACQMDSCLFISISNEGLRIYTGTQKKPRRYCLTSGKATKNHKYSVYKVIPIGDSLFCATSNGLGVLSPDDTCIRLLYNPIGGVADYKICKDNQKMWVSENQKHLNVFHEDSLLTFTVGLFSESPSTSYQPNTSVWRDSVTQGRHTYYIHKEESKTLYWNVAASNAPKNMVLLSSFQNGTQPEIWAVTENHDVYVGNREEIRYNRAWSRGITRNVEGTIKDALFFPNTEHCLLLTESGKLYEGTNRNIHPLKFKNSSISHRKIVNMYYSRNLKKVFLAIDGEGFVNFPADGDNILKDEKDARDCQDGIDYRCFVDMGDSLLCQGTLNYGCRIVNRNGKLVDSIHFYDNEHKDKEIRCLQVTNNHLFLLTPDSLHLLTLDSLHSKVKKGWKADKIERILPYDTVNVIGISRGEAILFNTNGETLPCRFPFPLTNIHALAVNQGSLVMGAKNGVYAMLMQKEHAITPVIAHDPLWRPIGIWPFVLGGGLLTVIIVVILLYRRQKRRLKNLTEENKKLTESQQSRQKAWIDRLLRHSYLTKEFHENSIPDSGTEPDWVTRTAQQYDSHRDETQKAIIDLNTGGKAEQNWGMEIERKMFKYAFAVDLLKLRNELAEQEKHSNGFLFHQIEHLIEEYLGKCVSVKNVSASNAKKNIYLHLWIIALLSKNGRDIFKNDEEFVQYLDVLQNKGKESQNPKQYITNQYYLFRKALSENKITPREPFQDVYEEMRSSVEQIVGKGKGSYKKIYELDNLSDMEAIRELLQNYLKKIWDNVDNFNKKNKDSVREAWIGKVYKFYNFFQQMFEDAEGKEKELTGVLLVWVWTLALEQIDKYRDEDYFSVYMEKMWKKCNDSTKTERDNERWRQHLIEFVSSHHNSPTWIKVKKRYSNLVEEYKKPVLSMFPTASMP